MTSEKNVEMHKCSNVLMEPLVVITNDGVFDELRLELEWKLTAKFIFELYNKLP